MLASLRDIDLPQVLLLARQADGHPAIGQIPHQHPQGRSGNHARVDDVRRHADSQFRVGNDDAWQHLGVEDDLLLMAFGIGDDAGAPHFRSSPGGGWNRDDGRDRVGIGAGPPVADILEIPDRAGLARHEGDHLAEVEAGAAAAASLGEMGFKVKCFTYHDSPRRAHSIAAQGGINAAKNYQNDGDSIWRLFYDTIKGGDYRAREANVYRLAQVSNNIIDQCVAQGVPFAREYGGYFANRSFGGALVSRTFYARGQTGQQLLLGAYSALMRQVGEGTVKMYPREEMVDLVLIDGKARGIITRNLITGEFQSRVWKMAFRQLGCCISHYWMKFSLHKKERGHS